MSVEGNVFYLSSAKRDNIQKEAWHRIPLLPMEVLRKPCNAEIATVHAICVNHYTPLALHRNFSGFRRQESSITLRDFPLEIGCKDTKNFQLANFSQHFFQHPSHFLTFPPSKKLSIFNVSESESRRTCSYTEQRKRLLQSKKFSIFN